MWGFCRIQDLPCHSNRDFHEDAGKDGTSHFCWDVHQTESEVRTTTQKFIPLGIVERRQASMEIDATGISLDRLLPV